MCKNEMGLMAALGASFITAIVVIGHIVRAWDPSSGVASVLGAMSFALAAVVEIDA